MSRPFLVTTDNKTPALSYNAIFISTTDFMSASSRSGKTEITVITPHPQKIFPFILCNLKTISFYKEERVKKVK